MRRSHIITLLAALSLGAWSPLASAATENSLLDMRVGKHKSFDRIVFEFSGEVPAREIIESNGRVSVRFRDVTVPAAFSIPALPRGLSVLSRIDLFREGAAGLLFEIVLSRDASPSELPLQGNTWRLAVDLAPRVSEKKESKPEYIPGDQPIPTKFAETTVPSTLDDQSVPTNVAETSTPFMPGDQSVPTDLVETKVSQDTLDLARLYAVLAYYYAARGESDLALKQADRYQQLTGRALDLAAALTPPVEAPKVQVAREWWSPFIAPVLAFLVGLAAGLALRGIRWRPRLRTRQTPPVVEELSQELAQDLDALDQAVTEEPPRQTQEPEPLSEPEAEAVPVPDQESEMAETLMDRRVRRVLELSREGRGVGDIAEELQMGIDEVRLILDLNQ